MGTVDLENDTLGIYLPPKHVLWCKSVKPRSMDCSVDAPKELKNKKALDVATGNFTPTPRCIPKAA